MINPHCGNSSHAQAAHLAANDNRAAFQSILIGLIHDTRGLISLIEDGPDRVSLRELKQSEAILQQLLKRS